LYSFNGDAISAADISSTNIFMHVDRMRLKQIFLNLLSNAVKYNVEEGSIYVMCDVSNSVVRISVVDTGKGISSDGLKELFTSFNRLGEENGSVEGSGIGLVITKKLVELMGGNIGADSKLDVGSTFWVEFPSVSSSNSSVTAENNTTETNTLLENNVKHTVLYIEDNPANLRLVEQILSSRTNVNMISAPEPNLGLELAYTKLPDLILLDLNLPGMSGFEVLKKLKENESTKNIPVFAVSANAMITDIEKGMDAGFDDYITKPVDVKTFIVSITKILKK
jgi:CheY-like chemotaxis protein